MAKSHRSVASIHVHFLIVIVVVDVAIIQIIKKMGEITILPTYVDQISP